MADESYRTLQYVEVIYLSKGEFKSRKHAHYPVEESEKIFRRTINKITESKESALICLRKDDHSLLKSQLIT